MKIQSRIFVLVVQSGKKLIDSIINFKLQISIFFLILPILILIAFLFLFETNPSNLFFIIIFLLNYYITIFILLLVFAKLLRVKKARSPFYFIKRLNQTGNKNYWDEYNQPLRHLIGVEIGVYEGDNSKNILNLLNIKELVLVDPWVNYDEEVTGISAVDPSALGKGLKSEMFLNNCYELVKNKFSNNSKVRIIRDYSVNASKMFDDEYFDFVYIDGNHDYAEVLKDLEAWYPKLKKFGVMCGDDYGHPSGLGVIKAVNEFAYKQRVIVNVEADNQFFFVKV